MRLVASRVSKICNECGRPMALGSGRFLSRILDLHLVEERQAFGKPYPEGDFLCMDCAVAPSHQIIAQRARARRQDPTSVGG